MTEAIVTQTGQTMSEILDAAREGPAGKALAGWGA